MCADNEDVIFFYYIIRLCSKIVDNQFEDTDAVYISDIPVLHVCILKYLPMT